MIYTYEPENEIVIDVVNRICYQKTKEYLLKLSNVTIKKRRETKTCSVGHQYVHSPDELI